MEKVRISVFQMFVLIFLFEAGSIFLVIISPEARQDVWIAVLIGLMGVLLLFLVFYRLYEFYPDMLPTTFLRILLGKYLGWAVAFSYVLYSIFMSSLVLRAFGEIMVTFSYPETPLFVINLLLMIVMIYAVRQGIEVIGRTGEFLFIISILLTVLLTLLLFLSGNVELKNLTPVLEKGIAPVIKVALTETLYVPFGELVVFALLLPYVKKTKKMKLIIFSALFFSGMALAITKTMDIAVLGPDLTEGSLLPTLDVIQSIDFLEYLQRLDVFFIILIVIGAFIKCLIFFFVAVSGSADLFNIQQPYKLAIPIGVCILIISLFMVNNVVELRTIGTQILPLYIHLPFQVIIPIIVLIVAYIKNRGKAKQATTQMDKE